MATRKPARQKGSPTAQGRVSKIKNFPAPVGGLNARDALAAMPPRDAYVLENWFPRVTDCAMRGGAAYHVTAFAKRLKTLAPYNAPSGSNKLFGITDDGIFDATSAGAAGVTVLARTSGRHQYVQMGVTGGNYLLLFNGVDKPAYYTGSAWVAVDAASSPALTGVTTTNLIAPCVYNRRLYLVEKDKLNFWYLAADAVGGALTEFLLGPVFTRGGYTMAMAPWSMDSSGTGPADYLAIVTSEGELALYRGTNPSDATAWTMVSVFYCGRPLGRQCFVKLGGDLGVLTEFGLLPLSKLMSRKDATDFTIAYSDKIINLLVADARNYYSNVEWSMVVYPGQNALLVNVPPLTTGAGEYQYVMNTVTKAWAKFTAWEASCWAVFGGELYYGGATFVSKAWTGRGDYSANIIAEGWTAYNQLGDLTRKLFKMFQPMLAVDGNLAFQVGMDIDFRRNPVSGTASYTTSTGALWDVDYWDQGFWAYSLQIMQNWTSPAAWEGHFVSGQVKVSTNTYEVQWLSNAYMYESGGLV